MSADASPDDQAAVGLQQDVEPTSAAESIVVGVDGSAGSLAALDWAVHEAQLRSVGVRAVMAWQQPTVYGGSSLVALGADPSIETKQELAAAAAVEVAALQRDSVAAQGVTVTYEAIEGHPAQVLVTAAEAAPLLVVGSRGHGGFVGALLGSVSQHVVSHARGPVVVVPDQVPLPEAAGP